MLEGQSSLGAAQQGTAEAAATSHIPHGETSPAASHGTITKETAALGGPGSIDTHSYPPSRVMSDHSPGRRSIGVDTTTSCGVAQPAASTSTDFGRTFDVAQTFDTVDTYHDSEPVSDGGASLPWNVQSDASSQEASARRIVFNARQRVFFWDYLNQKKHEQPFANRNMVVWENVHDANSLLIGKDTNVGCSVSDQVRKLGVIVSKYDPACPHRTFMNEIDGYMVHLKRVGNAEEVVRESIRLTGELHGNRILMRLETHVQEEPSFDMAESLAAIVVYYARHRNDPGKDVHEATSYVVDERLLIGTFLNSDRTNAGDPCTDLQLMTVITDMQNAIFDVFETLKVMRTTFGVPSSAQGKLGHMLSRNVKTIYTGFGVVCTIVTGVNSGITLAAAAAVAMGLAGMFMQILANGMGQSLNDPIRTYATQISASAAAFTIQSDGLQTFMGLGEVVGAMLKVCKDREYRRRHGQGGTTMSREDKMAIVVAVRAAFKYYLPHAGHSIQDACQKASVAFYTAHWRHLDPDRIKALVEEGVEPIARELRARPGLASV
ncbi:hypothetical protein EV122DRAFT_285370 [Schizophyllum commune]